MIAYRARRVRRVCKGLLVIIRLELWHERQSLAYRDSPEQLALPPGYSLSWSGQYEYMERAKERLTYVVPLTLALIVVLLFMNFRRFTEVALILATLPLALVGGIWLLYWEGYNLSVAVGVGR